MAETPTIRKLLDLTRGYLEGQGIEGARLDAEVLLAHALSESRLALYLDLDRPLAGPEVDAFRALVRRRGRREPVAYILGEREFYGHRFDVGPGALVPRPETEHLVDEVLARIPEDARGTVVDLCTGTAAIACAIALARPSLSVVATDVSTEALTFARANIAAHGLADRVTTREGDLYAALDDAGEGGGPFLAIVANPPYVKPADMGGLMPDVARFEPALALVGRDPDGLGHHRAIVAGAAARLVDAGFVALEIGFDQGEAVAAIARPGLDEPEVIRDLAGHPRVAVLTKR